MFWGKHDAQGRLIKTGRLRTGSPDLLAATYQGDTASVKKVLADGADIDMTDSDTGLAALHIAVGTNNLALTRTLIEEHKASLFPDLLGRWPSLIAAQCQVDEELSDYIVHQEARFLENSRS